MSWLQMLKPTRWKVVISLVPFVFTLAHIIAELSIDYGIIPVELEFVATLILVLLLTESSIAQPLAFLLEPIEGFWSHGSLGPFPEGPLLLGSFAVAIIYSILIYLLWSLVSFRKDKRR